MTVGNQISIAFKGYGKAFNLAFKRGYAKYFLYPLLINLLLFVGGMTAVGGLSSTAAEHFEMWIGLQGADFWGAEFLSGALSGVIWLLVKILFFFIFAYYGGFIVMIVMSPILSVISEKVEKEYLGEVDYPFNFKQLVKDVLRGLAITIRNMFFETLFLILTFVLSFIPVIGWLMPIVMFFISGYFFGFSYMDYTNERHGRNLRASVRYVRKYKWIAVVNGAVFSLSLMVPFCGVVVSTFFAILSVMAATVSMVTIESSEPVTI